MKQIKLSLAGYLAIFLMIISIYAGFVSRLTGIEENLIIKITRAYLISYIGFKISYMETKKVLLIALPLIFHTFLMLIVVNRNLLNIKIFNQLVTIISNLYMLVVIIGGLFVVEYVLNKILGSMPTSIIGVLSLLFYLVLTSGKFMATLMSYKDIFLYFAFYIMAIRIRSASKINPLLIVLSLIIMIFEIYIKEKYISFDYEFILSTFPLTYLMLKAYSNHASMEFIEYVIFANIFLYPSMCVILKQLLPVESLSISIISILISFIISQALWKIKNKYLSLLIIGIS